MKKYILIGLCCLSYCTARSQEGIKPCQLPQSYLSLGVAMMESKAATTIKGGTVSLHENLISDRQPSLKIALGSQIFPRWRFEGFYQLRNPIKTTSDLKGIPYSAQAKMQDFGINSFFTINPHAQTRFFIGAGLWGTNIRPKFTLMNIRATELFTNAWFLTPVGFIGIEWPDETNNDALDVTLFCGRTFIHKSYSLIEGRISLDHMTSCGASLNFRFGLS